MSIPPVIETKEEENQAATIRNLKNGGDANEHEKNISCELCQEKLSTIIDKADHLLSIHFCSTPSIMETCPSQNFFSIFEVFPFSWFLEIGLFRGGYQ